MDFEFTPEEALPIAQKLVTHLQGLRKRVHIELPAWEDTPYRTTLFTRQSDETVLYEVQGKIQFHDRLQNFSHWLGAQGHYAELNIVGPVDSALSAGEYAALQKSGVGFVLLHEDDSFEQIIKARNPALIVRPEPTLKYGDLKGEINGCVKKFNDGARKDGLRDLCEVLEGQTQDVLSHASTKGWVKPSVTDVRGMDWSSQINTLGSQNAMHGTRDPIIDDKLKTDLHSFRGARNLLDHKATSKADEIRRQRQLAERVMMGTRLSAELTTIRRKIK